MALQADVIETFSRAGAPLFVLGETSSTNELAKEWVRRGSGRHGALFVADHQTAGRGRRGRRFFSPPGTGLYMTLVLKQENIDSARLTIAAAAAFVKTAERFKRIVQIKWINDIFYKGRKTAGILAERVFCGEEPWILVGIGVNCVPREFPEEIRETAGTLELREEQRSEFAGRLWKDLLEYSAADAEELLEEYRRSCFVLGAEVEFEKDRVHCSGTAADIDAEGHLIVLTDSGEMILDSGEVSVRWKKV